MTGSPDRFAKPAFDRSRYRRDPIPATPRSTAWQNLTAAPCIHYTIDAGFGVRRTRRAGIHALVQAFVIALLVVVYSLPAYAAQPRLDVASLTALDRVTLEATLNGNVLQLEPHLAASFQASIEVPTDRGEQRLQFDRNEFLLYAWQARAAAEGYSVRAQPARYRIAADGRSAIGTRTLTESLRWNGQPLRYTTERTTHYRPVDGTIVITHLQVRIVDWDQSPAGR